MAFILSLFTIFSPQAHALLPGSNCYINATLVGEAGYFIEKAFDQWRSDLEAPALVSCQDGIYSFPVQLILTGRGLAYGFSNTSKIRISISVPQQHVADIIDKHISLVLSNKQLIIENVYDYLKLKNTEIYIENSLSENEIKSISESALFIKSLAPHAPNVVY